MANTTLTDAYGRSEDDRKEMRAKIDRVNKEAFDNWDNPQWRREMAQQLTDTVYRGFDHENLLSMFADVENAPFDGRVFVKEVRGLRAFWVARGGYIEASNMHAEVMEIPRDTVGFHVYEMEDKLRTNFAETQSTLVDLSQRRMDAEINRRVFALFQAAVPSSATNYYTGSGLTLPALNTAMRTVREASNQFEVTLIGRFSMTDQIVDLLVASGSGSVAAGFTPETNESLLQRGVIGNYRGARIITLNNYTDDERVPFFPANELWVVARDASKFAFWGGLLSKEYVEEDNWYWHYLARRDFGGVVHRPERLYRIVDSSIQPYTKMTY
jgi:hypothetical protein